MLDVVKQCDVLPQVGPGDGQHGEDSEAAKGDPQRVSDAPEQHHDNGDKRCGGQGGREIGIAVAGAAVVRQQGPGDDQAEQNQAAQQLGRGQGHVVRWLAMWAARARSEEKMRRLS